MNQKWIKPALVTIVILLAFGLFACERETTASELKVEIVQPTYGEVLTINKEVIVRSSIVPGVKWSRLELLVNQRPIRLDLSKDHPANATTIDQPWIPTHEGAMIISVNLYDEKGKNFVKDEVAVFVQKANDGEITPSPSATEILTATPTATSTPEECSLSFVIISESNVPGGNLFSPDWPITKTWQIQNTSSCDWDGFRLVYVRGDRMDGKSPSRIPKVMMGEVFGLSLELVAPSYPGIFEGVWQIQSDKRVVFGPELIVRVGIPVPTATDVPMPVDTAAPEPTSTPFNTPMPTMPRTPIPTVTNTLLPTSSYTETPVPTNTPNPENTSTPAPTNAPEPTQGFTPTIEPTEMPIPTTTPGETPTPTAFLAVFMLV